MTTANFIKIFMANSIRIVELTSDVNKSMEWTDADFAACRSSINGFGLQDKNYSWCFYENAISKYTIARQYLRFDLSGVSGTILSAEILVPDAASGRNIAVMQGTNIGTITTADFSSYTVDMLASGFEGITTPIYGTKAVFNTTGLYVLNLKGTRALVVIEYNYDYGNVAPSPGGLIDRTSPQVAKLILKVKP